jgi:hypothetical protein
MHEFAKAMCGETNLNDWFESLIPDDKSDDFSFREGVQHRIISLFNDVLDMIKDTGILENGDLAVAWLSPGNALNTLTLSARKHPWIKVLSDSSLTATFACISPHCFQTVDCSCQNGEWQLPSEFRLSTKLDIFGQYLRPEPPRRYALRIQKSYPINSSTLNILAKINGVIMPSDADPCYYITIKKASYLLTRCDTRDTSLFSAKTTLRLPSMLSSVGVRNMYTILKNCGSRAN